MKKQYTKKLIVESIKYWKGILREFLHDGAHIPRHPSRRNPTDKPTKYYVAVSYSPNFDDGQFVAAGGGLTRTASNNDFNRAATTIIPAKAVEMAERAAAKYGKDMYVFLFKEEYSHGSLTLRDHARSGLRVDKWYPKDLYWSNGLLAVKQLLEGCVNESSTVSTISISCHTNPDYNGTFDKVDVEEEMDLLGIDNLSSIDWLSYVFNHMFDGTRHWTQELENAVLPDEVKSILIAIGDDIVKIVKK